MPIPKPKKDESKDDFVSRCMSAIGDEYDDKDQALAICFDAWRDKDEEKVVKMIDCQVREIGDPEDRTLEFVGSDETVDSYGDIMEVGGWDLERYQKNPVFLWAHDYAQPPIGKAIQVVKDGALKFQIKFADKDTYPFADTVYKLYKGGFLRGTSVGFLPREREDLQDEEGARTGWRFKRQELLELSAVPVPSNPNALVMAVQKGIVSPAEVEHVFEVPYEKGLIEELILAERRARSELYQNMNSLCSPESRGSEALEVALKQLDQDLARVAQGLEDIKEFITEFERCSHRFLTVLERLKTEGEKDDIYALVFDPAFRPHGKEPASDDVLTSLKTLRTTIKGV